MDTVYKLINLIVSRGVPVGSVLLMLLYRLPQFLSVTLPIAVVITVVVVLVRLSNDLELTAMGASWLKSLATQRTRRNLWTASNHSGLGNHLMDATSRVCCL